MREYGDCYYCGGAVEEQLVAREIRWKGRLLIFEDVPMGVCSQCGEKVLKPDVAKRLDRALQQEIEPAKTIQVPVYQYESCVA